MLIKKNQRSIIIYIESIKKQTIKPSKIILVDNSSTDGSQEYAIEQGCYIVNYDKSEFEPVSRVKPTDEEIDKIWKSQYALKAFVDPSNFKSYEELKEKLNKTLTGQRSTESVEDIDLPPVSNDIPTSSNNSVEKVESSNDSDDLSYFSKLAEDDS